MVVGVCMCAKGNGRDTALRIHLQKQEEEEADRGSEERVHGIGFRPNT